MTRPLRLEFVGALYHVTSRGDHREDIFLCDEDRQDWLVELGTVCERFNWVVHAFCQMTNHYHLLLETAGTGVSSWGMGYQMTNHYHLLLETAGTGVSSWGMGYRGQF